MVKKNKKEEYFRFTARTVPAEYAIQTDSFLKEDVYTQMSKDEMLQFKLKRMPVYIDHESGIEVKPKVEGQPVEINASGKSVLGMVVDTMVTEKGAMLNTVEIHLNDDVETETGAKTDEMKRLVIAMIGTGYLGSVSLCHVPDSDNYPSEQMQLIQKVPLELSLTCDPARVGSNIIDWHYSDHAYMPAKDYEGAFDHTKAVSMSGVDFSPMMTNDNNNIHEKNPEPPPEQATTTEPMASTAPAAPPASGTAAPATKDEVERLRAELEKFRKNYQEIEPLATQYKKDQAAKQEAQKANFVAKQADVLKYTKEMLKALQDSKIEVKPEDKLVFDSVINQPEEQREALTKEMSSYLLEEARANSFTSGNPLSAEQIYNGVENVMNGISNNMVICAKAFTYLTPYIEAKNKLDAVAAAKAPAAAGINSSVVGSTAATKEPKFRQFEDLQAKLLNQAKSLYTNEVL